MKSPHVDFFDPVMVAVQQVNRVVLPSPQLCNAQKHTHTVTHRHTTVFQGTGSSSSSNSAVG